MKKLYLILLIGVMFVGCKPEPEFYIDGKPYYTKEKCIKQHSEEKLEYHFGYSPMKGKHCWHMGYHTVNICDESKIDTIEIKQFKELQIKK